MHCELANYRHVILDVSVPYIHICNSHMYVYRWGNRRKGGSTDKQTSVSFKPTIQQKDVFGDVHRKLSILEHVRSTRSKQST